MKKSEANRRIEDLRTSFEAQFSSEVLEEQSVRTVWLDKAARLAADIFGDQDNLYKRITIAQNMSESYEIRKLNENKLVLSQEWHLTVDSWLDSMSTSIEHFTKFDKTEFQNTKSFSIGFPILLAILGAIFTYFYSQNLLDAEQKFVVEQRRNQDRKELASVLVDFEYWSKGVQVGNVESLRAIAADFARRNVYLSGGHFKAAHNWALRRRFSMDSARSSYFAHISALSGDTLKLNTPRRLGTGVTDWLSALAKRIDIDVSHQRLDTL